jgi:hypothetical protein
MSFDMTFPLAPHRQALRRALLNINNVKPRNTYSPQAMITQQPTMRCSGPFSGYVIVVVREDPRRSPHVVILKSF